MMKTKTIVDMHTVIPEGQSGNVDISHFVATTEDCFIDNIRGGRMRPGTYCILKIGGVTTMSDTPAERFSNYEIIHQARGRVLLAGLGIGMITKPILKKSAVKSVLVVERNENVVKLVEPYLRHRKLKVVLGDIFEWLPEATARFDTIYFDVWSTLCQDQLPVMAKLHRKFQRYLNPDGFMDSWSRDLLLEQKHTGRRTYFA